MDKTINSYKKSGVNIDLGNRFVKHISKLTKSKGNNNPMLFSKNIGSFGAIYDIGKLKSETARDKVALFNDKMNIKSLDKAVGTDTENIFNRVLVATVSRDKKKITTTHSYYDCSNVKDFVTFDKPNSQKYNCFIPFNIIKDIDLDIVIYPIFSKSNLAFDLEMVNRNKEHKIIHVLNI